MCSCGDIMRPGQGTDDRSALGKRFAVADRHADGESGGLDHYCIV
jgi:hypothetical protein